MGYPCDSNYETHLGYLSLTACLFASSLVTAAILSSTTPSIPPQSLALFMDEGKLQAIRGEVIVRENGSKKITTEFDLSGSIKPSVMFSHLLKEEFPDSLKFQLSHLDFDCFV